MEPYIIKVIYLKRRCNYKLDLMPSTLVSFMDMPICLLLINIMYKQQTTVGGYPFVDFFLNARIKPVRIFIKIDHVTQGFMGNNYSLTPWLFAKRQSF
jgi:ABC-type uncharacterized transport system permease subunit